MHTETLTHAGLSINEAKVYEALLRTGEASVQDISLKAGVHRRNTYDSLSRLSEKGLALDVFVHGEKRYRAAPPTKLIEIMKEKEERIASALGSMQLLYKEKQEHEEAFLYKGTEGFKLYLQNILETGEEVCFIGAKAFWLDSRLQHYLTHFDKERRRKGIVFRHLFDYEVREKKPEILKLVGKPYKFLPPAYSSQTAVDIFGPYVVTFVGVSIGHLQEEPLQFVLKSRRLADGYRKYFSFLWDHCSAV